MRHRCYVMLCGMVVLSLIGASLGVAEGIDLQALSEETQKMSQKPNEMTFVKWIPEEAWSVILTQVSGVMSAHREEYLKIIRPYTMVAIVNAKIGAFGGMTYKSEDHIRANARIMDSQNKCYAPLTEDEIDADAKNMLQIIKPMIANELGPMGQNMHFLLFPGKTNRGARIAAAKAKGRFSVKLGQEEFKWRLPLDALLPTKMCTGCEQECKGSWNFCPWCGKKLGRK